MNDLAQVLTDALAPSRAFVLDSRALAMGHASRYLAIDPDALGQTFALDSAPPATRTAKLGDVAIVDIRGPLAQRAESFPCAASVDGYDAIEARFLLAIEDPSVESVMLRIDSPGGDCAGLNECVVRMQRARDRSGKHVAVYMDEKATSAAYALSMVASPGGIHLPESGLTGSVGVLIAHQDVSAALEKAGVKWTIIRSGPRKAEASGLEPLTDEAMAGQQGMVDELMHQFAAIVSTSRGISMADLRASHVLDGHCIMAREALKLGLVDKVCGWEEAFSRTARAGRKARKETTMKALMGPLGLPETATEAQALEKIEALKSDAASAKASLAAKVLEASEATRALDAEKLKADVGAAIDAAIVEKKIAPSAYARLRGTEFAAKHGLAALVEHYADMSPQPAFEGPVGNEEKRKTGAPKLNGERWEAMSPAERHTFHRAHGAAGYAELKADWERRGSPAPVIQLPAHETH